MKGRKFKGLRGYAGKPTHPPFTDVPVGAYVIAAGLDVISFAGDHTKWSHEFYQAATFVLIAGLLVSLAAVVTGVVDWWTSSEAGTQARRTINAHASIMVVATLVVLSDLGLRLFDYHSAAQPPNLVLALSLAAAIIVGIGATYGGSLVFDYGFNVETAGDHPVWHHSETDVFPGQHEKEPVQAEVPASLSMPPESSEAF